MSKMLEISSLLDLPEDVIYEILRFLDATSLYLLSKTCVRLEEIVRCHITLWRRVDARRSPNDKDKLAYCMDRCYPGTHTLLLRGGKQSDRLAPMFLPRLENFSKLAILACENQIIDGTKYSVMSFPSQLVEFSLKHTIVTKPMEFFKGSGDHFQRLRVLILDRCDWLNTCALMPISKYPNLEILSVYKCRNVENSIAYLTLSGQGFKSLKIFDARLSPLGNTLIRAIHRGKSLLAIYLQNEDLSYKVDYMRRRQQILQGSPMRDYHTHDNEFDITDFDNDEGNLLDDEGHCDDDGLIDYLSVQSDVKSMKLPQSVLYVDPYGPCSCGFEDPRTARLQPHNGTDGDDDDDDHRLMADLLKRYIEGFFRSSNQRPSLRRGLHTSRLHPTAALAAQYQFYDRYFTDAARSNMEMEQVRAERNDGNPNDNENRSRSVIKLYIFPPAPSDGSSSSSSSDDSPEPSTKRQRTDEAGPSGINISDSDFEELMGMQRPPTPHPDVAREDPNERGPSYRIYFRDSPVVQIENINDMQKGIKVPLRRLSLRGYKKITNAALRYISDLDLDLLDVTYTSMTYEGLQNYLTTHPLCRVVHERFCKCLPNMHF